MPAGSPFRFHWLAAAVFCLPSAALAQSRADTESCLEAHVDGQRQMQEKELKDAALSFERCAEKRCPKVVRRDCGKLLDEARSKLPSVRLDVSDHRGRAVEDATIVIDGKATETKSGETLELDPGKHWARVIGPSGRSVEVTFDLEEGQRDVRVSAELPPPPEKPKPRAPPPAAQSSAIPTATWVSGGVAVVGLVGFALFALSGSGKQSDLDACKPDCTDPSVYDDMKRDYLIADISLAAGVVAAGIGTYFYLTRDDTRTESARGVPFVRARLERGGGRVQLGASF